MFFQILPLFAAILLTFPAYSEGKAQGDNSHLSPEEKAQFQKLAHRGEPLFQKYCAHCHGIKGKGNGYNAEYLEKEPAVLSDTEFISDKSNKQIYRVIYLGGKKVRKSHLMPPFGHTLSEAEIWSLVAYVRKLAGDESHPITLPESVDHQRPNLGSVSREKVKKFRRWLAENGEDTDILKKGEYLFKWRRSCFACHQVQEEGGRVGPNLSRAGDLYYPDWIYAWVSNPQQFRPQTRMPDMGIEEEEIRVIAAYMSHVLRDGKHFPEEWKVYFETPGNPQRGESLFFDPDGKVHCAKCHRVNGKGGEVGPDLSFVGTSRKPRFLLESVLNPKAVITSGYTTVLILTKDRKFITGVKKNEDESSLDVVDKEGNLLHILKSDIKKFKTQEISTMPGNFKDLLSVQEVADLLTYLETLTLPQFPDHTVN